MESNVIDIIATFSLRLFLSHLSESLVFIILCL